MSSIQKARVRAFEQQNGTCCYCAGQMAPACPVGRKHKANSASAEHLKQRCLGGKIPNNIVASCKACNALRPTGMRPSNYAMLRRLLIPIWSPGTRAPRQVRQILGAMNHALSPLKATKALENAPE